MYSASAKSRKIPGFHFQKSRDFHQPQIPGSRDSRDPAKACRPVAKATWCGQGLVRQAVEHLVAAFKM